MDELKSVHKNWRPHDLARIYETDICSVVAQEFSLTDEPLQLLLQDEKGVYLSQKEANTLCCLVLGENNGHIYLVSAEMSEDKMKLSGYKARVVS